VTPQDVILIYSALCLQWQFVTVTIHVVFEDRYMYDTVTRTQAPILTNSNIDK